MQVLAEELESARQDVDRLQNQLQRVSKEKEGLTLEKGELIVQVTANERENRQQSELIAALRKDFETLKRNLYKCANNLAQLEVKKQQLEVENQDLLVKKENLQGEIARLMKEKDDDLDKYGRSREDLQKRLAQLERDMQTALTQEKQAHEDDVDRLMREKFAMDMAIGERQSIESQLNDDRREAAKLQAHYNAHSVELNASAEVGN